MHVCLPNLAEAVEEFKVGCDISALFGFVLIRIECT